jgi:hypothetical protein
MVTSDHSSHFGSVAVRADSFMRDFDPSAMDHRNRLELRAA